MLSAIASINEKGFIIKNVFVPTRLSFFLFMIFFKRIYMNKFRASNDFPTGACYFFPSIKNWKRENSVRNIISAKTIFCLFRFRGKQLNIPLSNTRKLLKVAKFLLSVMGLIRLPKIERVSFCWRWIPKIIKQCGGKIFGRSFFTGFEFPSFSQAKPF